MSFQLLIVDDEELTRTGLISSIDWDSLGITEILQADDGVNGLEMARLYKPEIILCDVRMPRMTGIAMLDKFKGLGWKKPYLIYGMCDETFSINCSAEIPEGIDRGWFYFFVTLLNQFYWVASATLGGVLGSFIHFNTEGLDFVMTAMFVVIFLEQWLKEKHHASEWIGLAASVGCLLLFGADNFLVPTMICILAALTALRRPLEKERGVTAP